MIFPREWAWQDRYEKGIKNLKLGIALYDMKHYEGHCPLFRDTMMSLKRRMRMH